MFDLAVIEAAKRHAEQEFPRESCGLVIDGAYVPHLNHAEDPEHDFLIPASEFCAASSAGQVQAVIHSHPGGPAHPSYNDMAGQIASGLPWGIIVTVKDASGRPAAHAPFWWGPGAPRPPLVERPFRCGVDDCYAILMDWFREEWGIILPDYPRSDDWTTLGRNDLMENLEKSDFRVIDTTQPKPGDVAVMQVLSPVPNHLGIYTGNGLILHHLRGRLSAHEPLHRWRREFRFFIRHRESRA